MKFGEKLRGLRKEANMRQSDLAKEIGVSQRTIISYEKSKSYPKQREVYSKLANFFDVDINYLLTEGENIIENIKDKHNNCEDRQIENLVAEVSELFTSSKLSEVEKDAIMRSVQQAYWDGKGAGIGSRSKD